jgi:microcystin-dependent protein
MGFQRRILSILIGANGRVKKVYTRGIELAKECLRIPSSTLFGNPYGLDARPVFIGLGDRLAFQTETLITTAVTLRHGEGAPDPGLGVDGDYYIDTQTGGLYVRNSGSYSIVADLTGPAGPGGPPGEPGPPGPEGATGPTGSIVLWPLEAIPSGWLKCDGTVYNIADYPDLGTLLGNSYGGDGTTTFGVPDYRGRIPAGAGQGIGLTDRTLGSTFGSETYTIQHDDLPDHSHTVTIGGHSHVFAAEPHTHTDNGHGHSVNDPGHAHTQQSVNALGAYDAGASVGPNYVTINTGTATTGITIATGNASLQTAVVSGTTNSGGSFNGNTGGIFAAPTNQTAVPLIQPSLATHFIIRT